MTLYITEYSDIGQTVRGGAQAAAEPSIADQAFAVSGTSAASNAFNALTTFVRIHTDSICSITFGTAPTALTTHRRMVADQTEYFAVPVGKSYKVAAITNV